MEVNLEHAHLLASTLMWKRFGDEKPKLLKDVALKRSGESYIRPCGLYGDEESKYYRWVDGNVFYDEPHDSDLWLYLSDLDVLRVKG